jgi:hypothetical protein
MPTAEGAQPAAARAAAGRSVARPGSARSARRWAWAGLALVLLGGLGLRLWGVKSGLPYIYNIDEAGHFVPKAVAMSSGDLNPRYFVNPPALTYALHAVFAVWFGGGKGVRDEYMRHPGEVFLVARVTVALLGGAAIWLLYAAGARLLGRGVGLLAAALEAVAFLPVFYGHFALNDAPTLAPLTLSLLGSALVLRRGRALDYALAGAGLGLGCATKYTAGIAVLPLLAAAAARWLDGPAAARWLGRRSGARWLGRRSGGRARPERPARAQDPWPRVAGGLALAAACAIAAFLLANPYALIDFHRFQSELARQSSLSGEAQGKLGAPRESGIVYYLWSLTWGLGWAPALAALGGAALIWRRHARAGWLLVPAPLAFLVLMGVEGRYFGRWLLPVFPLVCLLAAYFALAAAGWLAGRVGARASAGAPAYAVLRALTGAVLPALAAAVLLAQGLLYSIHSDTVLAREDTRGLTRTWMLAHVPHGARVVVEPVLPEAWLAEGATAGTPRRWRKYPSLTSLIGADGGLRPAHARQVRLEDYELTLSPALIGWYESQGWCWIVSGSIQSGRAFADPAKAPLAVAYYRALAARAQVAYRASPYARGAGPVGFSFDWSFDYYPLAYARPGPRMTVYRLRSGRCAR